MNLPALKRVAISKKGMDDLGSPVLGGGNISNSGGQHLVNKQPHWEK